MEPLLSDREKEYLKQGHHESENDSNWIWDDDNKKKWELLHDDDDLSLFYQYWRNRTDDSFETTYPYPLPPDAESGPPLPFCLEDASKTQILVIKAYDVMFRRLLKLRMEKAHGAVITGQPGTGKTTFLNFMLARLIVEKQMALLCTTPRIYLFYGGKVYARPTADGFVFLPWRKSRDERWPIWSLIDMDFCNHGPPLAKKFVTWPIQASSPNPVRYSALQKHYRAAVLGMPEWSKEDLMAGLVLDYRYNDFREKLRARLDLSTTDDVEFDAVLQVLRLEKEKANGSEDKMDVDVGKDQNAALGHAINTLLENAIDEFGSAPRDVYEGIFEILVAKLTHQEGLETLDFPALRKFVHGFIQEHTLDGTSDRIVAVYPKLLNSPSPKRDSWVIGFKSNRISQAAKRLYPEAEVEHLRDMFALFRKGLVSTSFAGWIFEGFVHHNFIHGWQLPSKPIPTLIPMLENSNGGKPPTFEEPAPPSTDTASVNPKREAADGTTDTPAIPHTPLRYKPSSWKMVTFTKPKDDYPMEVTLDPDTYYVPASFTNPLFDSFTIGYNDTTPGTYTIYIFQATVLEQDRGSSEGYTDIRKIVGRVEQLIEGNNRGAKVEVAFCLICPADSPANTWHMPVRENDHRVNAFCLRVPMKCSD